MRPLKLVMQAFGSYGEKTTIDFNTTNQNLFLITGDTGSGKSTIFDAIVFALYGEASSNVNKKDGTSLQSQFVEKSVEPYVELTFTHDQETYMIHRSPRHLSPKRGGGFKEVKETVLLYLPGEEEYISNQKETDAKIVDIIGLSKAEFMQVAMIAQGEFVELLRAKSDDKKKIFRKLFNTGIYEDLVRELDERRKKDDEEIKAIQISFQTDANRVQIPIEYDALKQLQQQIVKNPKLNVVDMESFIQQLAELNDQTALQSDEVQKQYQAAKKQFEEKNGLLEQDRLLVNAFEELSSASKEYETLQLLRDQNQQKEQLITKIENAYEIKLSYDYYMELKQQVLSTTAQLTQTKQALPDFQIRLSQAKEGEEHVRIVDENATKDLTITTQKANQAITLFKELETITTQFAESERHYQHAQLAETEAGQNLSEFETKVKEYKSLQKQYESAEKDYINYQTKEQQLSKLLQDFWQLQSDQNSYTAAEKKLEQLQKDYLDASQNYQTYQHDYQNKQTRFLDLQAGYLAVKELCENQPCPVCGSIHHPHPATLNQDDETITRELLEQMNRTLQELDQKRNKQAQLAAEQKSTLHHLLDTITSETNSLLKLMDLDETREDDIEEILNQRQKQLQQEKSHYTQALQIYHDMQEKLSHEDEQRKQLTQLHQLSLQELQQAQNIYTEFKSKKEYIEKQNKEFSSIQEAKDEITRSEKRKASSESMLKQAVKQTQDAQTALTKCQQTIDQLEKQLPQLKQEAQNRQSTYEKTIAELSVPDWQSLVATYRKEQIPQMRNETIAFQNKLIQMQTRMESAQKTIGTHNRPNLEESEKTLSQLRQQRDSLEESYGLISRMHANNEQIYKHMANGQKERENRIAHYNRILMLYRRLSGNVTDNRMDLETFVQRYYFERILLAANRRFTTMTGGQFELRMMDQEKAGTGKNKGLDIMVYSNVTGSTLDVSSLSGGESFMAALALALGMADQIQQRSASIHLDMMFIDEGFGSLDDHSRDEAVRVLQRMADGSKLIGIISHVTELKQGIGNQLVVTKDRNGSHVTWQI